MAREQEAAPVVGGSVNPMVMGSLAGRNNRMLAAQAEQRARIQGSQQIAVQREGIAAQRAMQSERIAADDRRQASIEENNRLERQLKERMAADDRTFALKRDATLRGWEEADRREDKEERERWKKEFRADMEKDNFRNDWKYFLNYKMMGSVLTKLFGAETATQKEITIHEGNLSKAKTEREFLAERDALVQSQLGALDFGNLPMVPVRPSSADIAKSPYGEAAWRGESDKARQMVYGQLDAMLRDLNVRGVSVQGLDTIETAAQMADDWDLATYGTVHSVLTQALKKVETSDPSPTMDAVAEGLDRRLRVLEQLTTTRIAGKDGKPIGEKIKGYADTRTGAREARLAEALEKASQGDPKLRSQLVQGIANLDPDSIITVMGQLYPEEVMKSELPRLMTMFDLIKGTTQEISTTGDQ